MESHKMECDLESIEKNGKFGLTIDPIKNQSAAKL
jgi:hypothetical protein